MSSSAPNLSVRVHAMWLEAPRILGMELRSLDGAVLPEHQPGAHIDLQLSEGLVRSYSLLPSTRGDAFRIAVQHERDGRGGSRFVHERLRVGDVLGISAPRQAFALHDGAGHSVLIAGGIGITPILSMYRHLQHERRAVSLLYCGRSLDDMAFREELRDEVMQWHTDDQRRQPPDLRAFMAAFSSDAHYYCCGPAPMIEAFERIGAELGYEYLHVERFAAATDAEMGSEDAFEVELARSGRQFTVPAGETILNVLLKAGLAIDHSCREGICGACETSVLEGIPEHHDGVLSASERAANKTMMVCVSGCRGRKLVLDL